MDKLRGSYGAEANNRSPFL